MINVVEQMDKVFEDAYTALRWSGYRGDLPDSPILLRTKSLIFKVYEKFVEDYVDPERRKLTAVLTHDLKGLDAREFVKKIHDPEFLARMEYLSLQRGVNACKNTSLLFNPHRLSIKTKKSESVINSLMSEESLSGLARAMLFEGSHKKGKLSVLRGFAIGANGIQLAYEFPPLVARRYCIDYGVPVDGHVLDPCAGWGGRMIGVSTVCRNYIGYEPSTKTYEGLLKLEKFTQLLNPDFNADIRKECFEDAEVQSKAYDMAITSPPYYDTEYYCDEETNSCNRYKSFDEWRDGFYLPMIQKTMNALKPGKVFILNIGSRTYPLNDVLRANFADKYEIERLDDNYLAANSGLRGDSEGESFYAIWKRKPNSE